MRERAPRSTQNQELLHKARIAEVLESLKKEYKLDLNWSEIPANIRELLLVPDQTSLTFAQQSELSDWLIKMKEQLAS